MQRSLACLSCCMVCVAMGVGARAKITQGMQTKVERGSKTTVDAEQMSVKIRASRDRTDAATFASIRANVQQSLVEQEGALRPVMNAKPGFSFAESADIRHEFAKHLHTALLQLQSSAHAKLALRESASVPPRRYSGDDFSPKKEQTKLHCDRLFNEYLLKCSGDQDPSQ